MTSPTTYMPPPQKRKRSVVTEAPIRIAAAAPAAAPTTVALPPPLMPYHPHLIPSYYPVYHQHPYFLSVGPQPPISPSLSPTLPSNVADTNASAAPTSPPSDAAKTIQRILPKSPTSTPQSHSTSVESLSLAPSVNYCRYPIQVSPQLHPTSSSTQHPNSANLGPYQVSSRHNSTSSQLGTTADIREQARKISHSAIERRRREKINDKIFQLKELIPSCSDRDNLHKMTILQSAIEYIKYLKEVVEDLEGSSETIAEKGQSSTKSGGRSENDQKFIAYVQSQKLQQQQQQEQEQAKQSMLPKEVELSTHHFTLTPPSRRGSTENNTSLSCINTTTTVSKKSRKASETMEEDEDDEEDSWSVSSSTSLPSIQTTGKKTNNNSSPRTPLPSLKPMDIINSGKMSTGNMTPSKERSSPPKIVVVNDGSEVNSPTTNSSMDRNMNLENILC